MITREEYLHAVRTIIEYRKQLVAEIESIPVITELKSNDSNGSAFRSRSIMEAFLKSTKMSKRAIGALTRYALEYDFLICSITDLRAVDMVKLSRFSGVGRIVLSEINVYANRPVSQ